MPSTQSDLLQGTLDLLILKSLALEQMHGMGISRRIAQITNGTFEVKAGSLFPALYRMQQAAWLTASWDESETNRRAKFYRLGRELEIRIGAGNVVRCLVPLVLARKE